jgi:hypothetical protein
MFVIEQALKPRGFSSWCRWIGRVCWTLDAAKGGLR